jgi:signal transduction histidine kinase
MTKRQEAGVLVQNQLDWEAVFDGASQPVVLADAEARVRYCNGAAERSLGLERGQAVDRVLSELLPGDYTGDVPRVDGWRLQRLAGGWAAYGEPGSSGESPAAADPYAAIEQLSAGLAHELGPPLTAISVATEYLLKGVERGSAEARDLETVLAQVERIGRLARQLVELGRPPEPLLAPLDFDEVVADGILLIERQLQRQGIHRTVALDAGAISLRGDANQLQQVVIDLVQHAQRAVLSAGAREKLIEVRTRVRADALELNVVDHGPPLTSEALARLFLPSFSRAETSEFGLYTARWIVHRHGGRLEATSGPGGTVFTVRFPIRLDGDAT